MAAPDLSDKKPKLKLYIPSLVTLNELNLGSKSALIFRFYKKKLIRIDLIHLNFRAFNRKIKVP